MYEVNKIVNEMNKVVDKVSKACDICLGRKKVLEDMKASHQDRWLRCILTADIAESTLRTELQH